MILAVDSSAKAARRGAAQRRGALSFIGMLMGVSYDSLVKGWTAILQSRTLHGRCDLINSNRMGPSHIHQPPVLGIVTHHALVGTLGSQTVLGELRRLLPVDEVPALGQADALAKALQITGCLAPKIPAGIVH